MGSIPNTVHYCSVSRGTKVLSSYSRGDQQLESLAVLCLERTPPFHLWYFHTLRGKIYGFLTEDGYVHFAIADEGLGNPGVLRFLEHVRDGFRKVLKNGSVGGLGLNACVHEELVPVLRRLITSLENVPRSDSSQVPVLPFDSLIGFPIENQMGNLDGTIDATTSTKAPLLGKPCKFEKKKLKDRVADVRDIVLDDHGKTADRGAVIDIDDDPNQGVGAAISLPKSLSSTRIRGQQLARRKWWRHVRIVLLVDLVVCLVLFGIWLGICKGFQCISH